MIIPSFYPAIGGAEQQVLRLSKALMAHGWPVRVLTRRHGPALPPDLPASEVVDGIPVTRLYSRGKLGAVLYVLGGFWYLLRYGRRGIYHAHDIGSSGWLAGLARHLLGGHCIVKLRTGRCVYEELNSSRIARWRFFTPLRMAGYPVVVNSEVEGYLHSLGISARRITRIPNGVDTHWFHPVSSEQKLAVRQWLVLETNKSIALYVGRLAQIKGIDILLKAWALLPTDVRRDSQLVLVGDGPEHDNLLNMASFLGIQESVLLAGMRQTVRDYYWAADIFVLPSRTEGLSNALVEAMACGLPTVASNVGGAIDVIKDGKNGMLFESENYEQLAQKLATLLTIPDQWPAMGTQARETVLAYADLDTVTNRLQELYYELF